MRIHRWMFLVVSLAMLAIAPIATAGAAQTASGSFVVTAFAPSGAPEQRGNACFIEADVTFSFTGTLAGDAPMRFRIIQSAPCDAVGPQAFAATGEFTGTVDGRAGSFRLRFQGHIDAAGNARGSLVIQHGTGELERLHGHLTLTGQAGVSGDYTGTITFAP